MAKQNSNADQARRKGDTSRSSSQGRKTSSGGNLNKRGNAELDENTKTPKKQRNNGK